MVGLMPFITPPASALLDQEHIGWIYLTGVVLILLSVWVGALLPQRTPLSGFE